MAELAAGHARTEAIIADTDRVVLETVGEVVPAFRHGPDEHAHALFRAQIRNVVPDPYDRRVEAERNFPTIRRKVLRHGIFDDLE